MSAPLFFLHTENCRARWEFYRQICLRWTSSSFSVKWQGIALVQGLLLFSAIITTPLDHQRRPRRYCRELYTLKVPALGWA